MTSTVPLVEHFRRHAELFGPSLYRETLLAMADDLESGGVVAQICRGREGAAFDDFVQLRLLAGVHRLVLTGRAPELTAWFPNLGGTAEPTTAWPTMRAALADHEHELRAALDIAPQTNEPGRAAALLAGLFDVVRRSGLGRVRLFEPGASAGLNLLVDRYFVSGDGWEYGPADSPLQLAGAVRGGLQPVPFEVIERRGCDLEPVDVGSPEGRLRLVSFVWPHQLDRHARLAAALRVADSGAAVVDRAAAADWIRDRLSEPPAAGVLSVVWHSITTIYWPPDEVANMQRELVRAGRRMPVAEIAMENPAPTRAGESRLVTTLWGPGRDTIVRDLGSVPPHGVPVRLSPAD